MVKKVIRLAKILIVLAAAAAGVGSASLLAHGAPNAQSFVAATPSFSLQAKVRQVVDGDTLIARVGRTSEHVRLIGIDAPEVGVCYSAQATARARGLSLNRRVLLIGDRTQARRDRYGRLLAYVRLPSGRDLGQALIGGGFAKVYVYARPFARLSAYRTSESTARSGRHGLWSACSTSQPVTTTTAATGTTRTILTTTTATTTTTPKANCAPSYPDVCIPPPPPDLNCPDVPYKNIRVIYTVPNPDPHGFDRDRDGIGCET
jgi:micrococcal nuclease